MAAHLILVLRGDRCVLVTCFESFCAKDQLKDLVSLSEDDVIWFNEKRITGVQSVLEPRPFVKVLEEARSNISVKIASLGSKLIVRRKQTTRNCSLIISWEYRFVLWVKSMK